MLDKLGKPFFLVKITVVTIVPLLFPTLYGKRCIFTRSPCSWVLCPSSFICYHVCLPRFAFLSVIGAESPLWYRQRSVLDSLTFIPESFNQSMILLNFRSIIKTKADLFLNCFELHLYSPSSGWEPLMYNLTIPNFTSKIGISALFHLLA